MVRLIPPAHNLTVYFVLPWIGLNRSSFTNFNNAFISYNGKIIVRLLSKSDTEYWNHKNYVTDFQHDGYHHIVYSVPTEFENDFSLFLDGKYSRFSDEAKNSIFKDSDLQYRIEVNGVLHTHKLLLVLSRNESLRVYLENLVDVVIPEGTELLNKPDIDVEVMDIDTDYIPD